MERIELSELTIPEQAYVAGYRRGLQQARAELKDEVRAIRERYHRALAELHQNVVKMRVEHEYRRALARAIEEREAYRPKLLH